MTRTFRHLAATAAVVVMVTIASSCGSSDDSDTVDTAAGGAGADTTAADSGTRGGIYGDTGTDAPAPPADTAAAAPATGDGAVSVANFTFDPGDVSVAAGTAVTWTNDDGVPTGSRPTTTPSRARIWRRGTRSSTRSTRPAPSTTSAPSTRT